MGSQEREREVRIEERSRLGELLSGPARLWERCLGFPLRADLVCECGPSVRGPAHDRQDDAAGPGRLAGLVGILKAVNHKSGNFLLGLLGQSDPARGNKDHVPLRGIDGDS